MKNEKMLIKKEKLNIFKRIAFFFDSILNKKNKEENIIIEKMEVTNENMFQKFEEEQETLILKEKYEKGSILEEDLNEIQKEKLIRLYQEKSKMYEEQAKEYEIRLELCNRKLAKM